MTDHQGGRSKKRFHYSSPTDFKFADIDDAVIYQRLQPGVKLSDTALDDVFFCSRSTVYSALACWNMIGL